jgi:hypothetical protein
MKKRHTAMEMSQEFLLNHSRMAGIAGLARVPIALSARYAPALNRMTTFTGRNMTSMIPSLNESFARVVFAHADVAHPQVSPEPHEGGHASGMLELVVFGAARPSSSAPVTMRGAMSPNMKRWKGNNAYQ